MKCSSRPSCKGLTLAFALLLAPLLQVASATAGAAQASATATVTQTQTNPYAPDYGHPYRHGVIPTRETLSKMKLWRALHAPTTSTSTLSSSNTLFYGGGTSSTSQGNVGVMNGVVKVYLVFWGDGWGSQSTDSNGDAVFSGDPDGAAPVAQEMFKGIGTGGETWSAELTQWCQGISSGARSCSSATPPSAFVPYQKGGILAGVWEDTSASSPINATGKQLAEEAIAAAQHFGNTTPASNRYAYYVIMSAHGDNPDDYQNPTTGYCAWHDWNGDSFLSGGGAASSSVGDIAFSNQPYNSDAGSSCGAGFVNSPGTLDGWTMSLGHEWQEMVSDTYPAGGWTDRSGYENADDCAYIASGQGAAANVTFATGTFTQQSSWSNDTNECDLTHAILAHATDGAISTPSNTPVSDTLLAADSDGDTLTYAIMANPSHGTVSITDASTGAFTYTPGLDYVGSDSFTFDVTDSSGDTSNTATESVTVTGNATPVATNGSISTVANAVAGGTLAASDTDGDTLTFAIVTNPSHGSVSITNASTGDFTYSPALGYAGLDSFTFNATDSVGHTSTSATESVTVNDNPPTANDGSFSTPVDNALSATLSASELDSGQTLTFAIVTQPAQGTVTISDPATGAFTYTPSAGYLGNASFTFKVNDGYLDSNTATVSLAVVDQAPVATAASFTIKANGTLAKSLEASDADAGQSLTYAIVTQPSHGTLSLTDTSTGAFTYTPASGFSGSDSFSFKVNDGYLDSNTATDTITITDQAPVATGTSLSVKAGGQVSAQLKASDADAGQSLTYKIVHQPAHGKVSLSAATGEVTYVPTSGFSGSDSFSFEANDGYQNSNTASVSVTVQSTGGGGGALGPWGLGVLGLLSGFIALCRRRGATV